MKIILLFFLFSIVVFGETIHIASASSMKFPLQEIISEFKRNNKKVHIKVYFDSSGNLTAKILRGAKYDLFISAGKIYASKLLGAKNNTYMYSLAEGKLALISRTKIDCNNVIDVLTKSEIMAIPNPTHAPYGKAGISFIKSIKLYEKLKERLVYGANALHVAHFVKTGNADLGITSLSVAYRSGFNFCIIEKGYEKPEYFVVVLNHKKIVKDFIEFLKSPTVKRILEEYGIYSGGREVF